MPGLHDNAEIPFFFFLFIIIIVSDQRNVSESDIPTRQEVMRCLRFVCLSVCLSIYEWDNSE